MSYEEAKTYLLKQARSLGIDVEILASETRELSLGMQEGKLSETTQASQGGLGLRVIVGGKLGYASTEERSQEALDWALKEAKENAELQSSSGSFLPTGNALGHKDLIGEGLSATMKDKVKALETLEGDLRKDTRVNQVWLARYTEREAMVSLSSTQGISGGYRNGACGVYSSFIMQEGDSLKQGFDLNFEKEFHALEPGKTALDMLHKTGRLLGAKPLKTGKYKAYFEPKAFANLLSVFFYMFSGKTLAEGKSRLAGKLGQKIASEHITLIDDPTMPKGLASRPFDSEGTPAKAVTLVEEGVFKSFLHNSATAKTTKQSNTGHAARSYKSTLNVRPSNLYLKPGRALQKDSGVLITNLSGLHAGANPVSGDLSLQGLGLLIQDGEIVHPVENFAISGNMLSLLENITAVGDDFEWLLQGPAIGSASVEVAELSFAGA